MQDIAPSLPQGVQGPGVNDEFGDTFGTIYGFTADGFSPRELRDKVDNIRRDLMDVPDTGKITCWVNRRSRLLSPSHPGSWMVWALRFSKSAMH